MKNYFEILACPTCFGKLLRKNSSLACSKCSEIYLYDDGLPVLISSSRVDLHVNREQIKSYYKSIEAGGWWSPNNKWKEILRRDELRLFRAPIRSRILKRSNPVVVDAGGGSGWFLSYLRQKNENISNTILFDLYLSSENVSINNPNGISANASITAFPLLSGSADIVTAIEVLEHVEDPQAFFDEVFRILKNNGELILTTPNPYSPAMWFEEGKISGVINGIKSIVRGRMPPKQSERRRKEFNGLERYISSAEVRAMASRSGFKSINVRSIGYAILPMLHYYFENKKISPALLGVITYLTTSLEVILYLLRMPYAKDQIISCKK